MMDDSGPAKRVPILFRHAVPEIPSTTFGTFGIYKYPAKFIPQVVAYVLKNYARPGMRVFDPFAGYGTTGLVSRVYGLEYELWDLNPIIETIHAAAIMRPPTINPHDLIEQVKKSNDDFVPNWSHLDYWIPEEFLPLLSKTWGWVHARTDMIKYLVMLPLLKVTRYFSYGDEKVHKLYKSKFAKRKVKKMLEKDWKSKFYSMLESGVSALLTKLVEYRGLSPKQVDHRIRSGIDTMTSELDHTTDILVTSPPYLQAQEYIRSTKLELFWLGYDEEYIRSLGRREIPYCEVSKTTIHSETFQKYREQIANEKLRVLYDRYFHAVLGAFARLGKSVTDRMCIFVGPAKIRTTSIPIDTILIEHLREFGWTHEVTFIDTIVSRVMFQSEINPASGQKDQRMRTEHLVVLRRE